MTRAAMITGMIAAVVRSIGISGGQLSEEAGYLLQWGIFELKIGR